MNSDNLPVDPQSLQWALPVGLEVPPDPLRLRLDFHGQSIVMHVIADGTIQQRLVSAEDITRIFARQLGVFTGMLPRETVWWRLRGDGPEVAIWRRPQVTRVALQEQPFVPATRLAIPMPGLLFICRPARPPWLCAMKQRPTSPDNIIYHAPAFNVFTDGTSCQGNHQYGQDLGGIPEEFFTAFFSLAGNQNQRSHQYPTNLRKLWEELDGKTRYPLSDQVAMGHLGDLLDSRS